MGVEDEGGRRDKFISCSECVCAEVNWNLLGNHSLGLAPLSTVLCQIYQYHQEQEEGSKNQAEPFSNRRGS